MTTQHRRLLAKGLGVTLLGALALGLTAPRLAAGDETRHPTGRREPTPQELATYRAAPTTITAIRLNPLGRERVAAAVAEAGPRAGGAAPAAPAAAVPFGSEIVGVVGATPAAGPAPAPAAGTAPLGFGPLPVAVDNSTLPSFPPIGNQGSLGSCASFSTTYYQLTHMTGLVRGWTAAGGDPSVIFSPKWTYNLINGGFDSGSTEYGAYNLFMRNGACRWSEFPYDGDYRAWNRDGDVWRRAIQCRIAATGAIGGLDTPEGLGVLKQLLTNGYVLCFATNVLAWQFTTVAQNPDSEADNPYVGQSICYYLGSGGGGHAMTIVGYNDAIWCDLNGNGSKEPEEVGALKIANSWGDVWNAGFAWLAYDALKTESAVPANGAVWPKSPRQGAFWSASANWIAARPAYVPAAVGVFTVRHVQRGQMSLRLGLGDPAATSPATICSSVGLSGGGAYAFDGSTTACDGTFALDFTELAPPAGVAQRFFLGMSESPYAPETGLIRSFTVTDAGGTPLAAWAGSDLVVDGTEAWVYANLTWTNPTTPEISVSVMDDTAVEETADPARLRVARGTATAGDLAVNFTLAGTATTGKDYVVNVAGKPVLGAVTIPAGATAVDLDIVALDDADFEDRETIVFTVTHGTGYATGTPAAATVYIENADRPQLELDLAEGIYREVFVPENGARAFRVRLNGVPTAPVVARVTKASGDADLTLVGALPIELTFDASTWHTWQSVTLAAADDADTYGSSAQFRVSAAGMASRTIYAYEIDDDQPALVADRAVVDVPEGGTATFALTLNRAPAADVAVAVSVLSGDTDLAITAGAALVFTPGNWSNPQTVTLAAADDLDGYEGTATVQCTASGGASGSARLTAREVENDPLTIGIIVPGSVQTVMEGGTSAFPVRLSGPPGGAVTVLSSRAAGDPGFTVTDGAALGFDDTNWNTPQYVRVAKAQDPDFLEEEATIVSEIVGIAEARTTYRELDGDVPSLETDTYQVNVLEGSTATLHVRLLTEPITTVTAHTTFTAGGGHSAPAGGDPDLTIVAGESLVFTPANWHDWQPVTVAAAEDADAVNGSAQLAVKADGARWGTSVQVQEIDNDALNIVTDTTRLTVVEGATAALGVRLSQAPGAALSVTTVLGQPSSPDLSLAAGASLAFDDTTWSAWQYVVVSAAHDADLADESGTLQLAAPGAAGVSVPVTLDDDDRPTLVLDTTHLSVPEGATADLHAKLSAAPPSPVQVSFYLSAFGDQDLTLAAGSVLAFDATNWDTWQPVTIAAAPDADVVNGWRQLQPWSASAHTANVMVHEVDADAPPNQPPVIGSPAWTDANPVTLPAGTTVHVVASDPDGDPLAYVWSQVSGAGTATFATPTATDSGVTFSGAGVYGLRVTISDGKGGSVFSDVAVTVNAGVDARADVNHDGVVNALDLQIVIANFGLAIGEPGCDVRADANGDGVVNALDLQIVIANFGQTVP